MTLKHLFTAGILCVSMLLARAATTPKVGDKAPDFAAQDEKGKTVKLSDYAGKHAVLLYF